MDQPTDISICIPAYKQRVFLKRLLDSIAAQSYRNYEIIVTDDSPDNTVQELCKQYSQLPLRYFRNAPALGSPANWNAAIGHATGRWIKLMHDDDWFSSHDALEKFAQAAQQTPDATFIFSGVYKVDTQTGEQKKEIPGEVPINLLRRSPLYLFKKNYIGHPSTTLIRNNITDWYDKKVKWVVDFEFYIRYLLQHKNFEVIREPLICIGISEHQITTQVFRDPAVEIPEYLYLYQKLPPNSFSIIVVYDHFWRLFRNLGIRTVEALSPYAESNTIPPIFVRMIRWQAKAPASLLKVGVFSKIWMFISYITNGRTN